MWQVLVSIQGLVLVPQPYFNEAGFEKQVGAAVHLAHRALHAPGSCPFAMSVLPQLQQYFLHMSHQGIMGASDGLAYR